MVVDEQRPMEKKSAYLELLIWCMGLRRGCGCSTVQKKE
jgi:hypothetical protein